MTDSDESLLKSFAIHRDEAAFRILAERYLGLIFHTALRRTNNRQLAQEVSQNILCALAKKSASLAKNPDLLPAWLHRATLFESSKAMRAESSHQRRKHLQNPSDTSPEIPSWPDALPHLDAALDKLPESDRRVLLLHFFENKSFPGIARSLGKSTAAVQKQSQRALEKLSRLLRARGVTLTATAIAAGLSSELAKAAPVTLLKSATTAALTGSAAYSTTGLTLMFATKSKAFIPIVVLLCLTPLAIQQVAISNTKTRIEQLRTERSHALSEHSQKTTPRPITTRSGHGLSTNIDLMILIEEMDRARQIGGPLWTAFDQKLAALPPDTLARLITEAATLRIQRDKKTRILESLVVALALSDPKRAVTTMVSACDPGPEFSSLVIGANLARPFFLWLQSNQEAALAWFHDQEKSAKFSPPGAPANSNLLEALKTFKTTLVHALILSSSTELEPIIATVPENERPRLLENAMRGIHSNMRAIPAAEIDPFDMASKYLQAIRSFTHEGERQPLFESLTKNYCNGNKGLETMSRLFSATDMTIPEKETMATSWLTQRLSLRNQWSDGKPMHIETEEPLQWLHQTLPDSAADILLQIEDSLAKKEHTQAQWVIHNCTNRTQMTDDELVSELTRYTLSSQKQNALEITARIKDPEKRARVIEQLNKQ